MSSASPPSQVWGLELQESHLRDARKNLSEQERATLRLQQADIFRFSLPSLTWETDGPLLVVGNPPWVLNSDLGARDSDNLPAKSNLKGMRGIDAITGGANFDIAEFIWLKLLRELAHESPTIALLCKTTVARNVLRYCRQEKLPVVSSALWRIDAKQWFGVSTDACLFCVTTGPQPSRYEAEVFSGLDAEQPEARLGFLGDQLVPDIQTATTSAPLLSGSGVEWRQGVKHDAASIFELRETAGELVNGLGETVDVEVDRVFPLLKCTDVFHARHGARFVLLPQLHTGDDTMALQRSHPRLWSYLTRHANALGARKSSIYRSRGPFAVFGIGPYAFAPFKVAVSGLHKEARFVPVGPRAGKPVLLDDTTYFIPADSMEQCAALSAVLNSEACRKAIEAIVFWDMKRPITKALLSRLNLPRIAERVPKRTLTAAFRAIIAKLQPERASHDRAAVPEMTQLVLGSATLADQSLRLPL